MMWGGGEGYKIVTDVCLTLTSILKWDKNSGDGDDDSGENSDNGDLVKSPMLECQCLESSGLAPFKYTTPRPNSCKYKYTNTQIHKYTNTQIHKYKYTIGPNSFKRITN